MKATLTIAFVGILGLGMSADARKPDLPMHSAQRVLRKEIESGRTPAVQYRHFTADSVLFSYGEGLADIARDEGVTDATLFRGFSVTKTVTAVAVLQLVDRGLVELDAPASTYLPHFPYRGGITVRHLLSHSAGIPNPLPLRWTHLPEEHPSFDSRSFFEPVFAAHSKTTAAPNRRMKYSNLGYVLLGQIIESVSGVSYEEYVTRNILEPIGLSPAELGFEMGAAPHATGYHRRMSFSRQLLRFMIDDDRYMVPGSSPWHAFRPYHVNGVSYGGLVGTADGFMRYVQALLDPGGGLLSEASQSELFADHVLRDGKRAGMSLSWFTGHIDGQPYRAHAGGGGGYYAEIRIYPELGLGSVILMNRSGFSDARVLNRVDRHLLADTAGPVR
jgi:D-alanyl-D-alanine carboxypeptidase